MNKFIIASLVILISSCGESKDRLTNKAEDFCDKYLFSSQETLKSSAKRTFSKGDFELLPLSLSRINSNVSGIDTRSDMINKCVNKVLDLMDE